MLYANHATACKCTSSGAAYSLPITFDHVLSHSTWECVSVCVYVCVCVCVPAFCIVLCITKQYSGSGKTDYE